VILFICYNTARCRRIVRENREAIIGYAVQGFYWPVVRNYSTLF